MRIEMYQDRGGGWRWRGVDGNNRIICDGAEGYTSRGNLEAAIDNVVNEFRSHLEVVCRERRGMKRETSQLEHEVVVIAEYQHQGEGEHGGTRE